MGPVLSTDDPRDVGCRDSVFTRQRSARSGNGSGSDLADLILRQLRVGVVGPASLTEPSLPGAIQHILSLGPDEEMRRLITGWVVAMMADVHSRGDWTIGQGVREPVGFPPHPVDLDEPVSTVVEHVIPDQALAIPVVVGPEEDVGVIIRTRHGALHCGAMGWAADAAPLLLRGDYT